MEQLLDTFGDGAVLAVAGALTGLIFGAAAQHSRFCLRAATIDVAHGGFGARFATWVIAFFAALFATQASIVFGVLDVSGARQIAATGSMSGAVVGGLMFGVGMVLARGCASRLLVLSATGNLRALITGLVVTLVAQASYRGILAPAREWISALWTVPGGAPRDLGAILGLPHEVFAALGALGLAGGILLARRDHVQWSRVISDVIVGLAVALGWGLTWWVASMSFEVVPVSSVTFTGPATDTLMGLVNERNLSLSFGIGLVPGVFVGSGIAALVTREFAIQRFGADTPMERYLIGAVLMGFGAMLAGGCAVGAGVSGGAILALTAWVAVACMWIGAVLTEWTLNGMPHRTGAVPA